MLREMTRIIQGQLREYDFLARYAGDEFVAIVQELIGNQVDDLRSRIEAAVSGFSLHVRGNGQARVGISIGTATYGIEGETLDQLLVAADQAMYRAKSSHKLAKISPSRTSPDPQASEVVVEIANDNLASTSVN
jgi:diguanylate cyclase (GGDEF)-like protein